MGGMGKCTDAFLRTDQQPRRPGSAGRRCGRADHRLSRGSTFTEHTDICLSGKTQNSKSTSKHCLGNDPLVAVLLLQQQGQPLQEDSQTRRQIQAQDVLASEDHAAGGQHMVLTDPARGAADQQNILEDKGHGNKQQYSKHRTSTNNLTYLGPSKTSSYTYVWYPGSADN